MSHTSSDAPASGYISELTAQSVTREEIYSQPDLWPTTVDRVANAAPPWEDNQQPVVITGAGTSAYAAAAIASSWPGAHAAPTTDLLADSPYDISNKFPGFPEGGVLISLARSGDSPESVAVVKQIQRLFPAVKQFAITCNADGRLANLPGVRCLLLDPRTNDRSLAMTSSFSNLVLAGLCFRHAPELTSQLAQICLRVKGALPTLDETAHRLAGVAQDRVVILASGPLFPMAAEASLKILEMTAGKVATLAETFLGLRHGPMSFLQENSLVLCFLSTAPARRRYEEDLLWELRQKRLGHIAAVVPDRIDPSLCDTAVRANAPEIPDHLRVPFEIPIAQLVAFHLSLRLGLNPDNPSPSGAITRVVSKFPTYEEHPNV